MDDQSKLHSNRYPNDPPTTNSPATGKANKPSAPKAEAPQPLMRAIPKGEPYPVEALGPLKDAVEAMALAIQAPPAIAAQTLLSMTSLAVQGLANADTGSGAIPASLFCLTVAQSGERKSACDKIARAPLEAITNQLEVAYAKDWAEWSDEYDIWAGRKERLKKALSGSNKKTMDAAKEEWANLPLAPIEPKSPKRVVENPTTEGLYKMLMTGIPSVGLFSDEGGVLLGGHSMSAENKLATIASYSKLWDGSGLDRVRSGDGFSTLKGRRYAIGVMMQGVTAAPLFADPLAIGQGFLPRCLITEPESTIGTRLKSRDKAAVEIADGLCDKLLTPLFKASLPMHPERPQELLPRVVPLSPAALHVVDDFARKVEYAQRIGGEYECVRGFASKAAEQACRIACVLTLAKHGGWAPEVSGETMADACTLALFYLNEARRLIEHGEVGAEEASAEELRKWLLGNWRTIAREKGRDAYTIVPSDVVQFGPNRMRTAKDARKHLKTLEGNDWVIALEAGTVIDGKPRKLAYRIVRGEA